jgi:hypothetical protein
MKAFTQWFILTAVSVVGAFFTYQAGALNDIFEHDRAHLITLIVSTYVGFSAFCGHLSLQISSNQNIKNLTKQLSICSFAAKNLVTLGLIATCFGFIMLMGSLKGVTDGGKIMDAMRPGAMAAFGGTITGIASCLLLQIQIFLIKYHIKDERV